MKDKMYILNHCETNEYIASQFRGYGKYELVSLNKLKEDKIYFKENEKIRNIFSKSYHVHFRGGDIDIKLQEINIGKNEYKNKHSPERLGLVPRHQFGKLNNLKTIDPKDLFNPQHNNNQSIIVS